MADEEPLGWAINFSTSGEGLQQAITGLVNFTGKLGEGRKALVEFEKDGLKFKASLGAASKGVDEHKNLLDELIHSYGHVKTAVMDVAGVIAKPLHLLDEFGSKATEAFNERTGTLRTWTALLGDASEAQREFSRTQLHALQTPFLSSVLETSKTQLMGQDIRNENGRSGGTLDKTLLALEDLSSRHHDRNLAMQRGTYAIDEILSEGHLSLKRMRQLSIDLMLPARRLAEAAGMTIEQFHKALKNGTIIAGGPDDQFLKIFQRAALLHTKESRLGQTSTAGAGGIGTLLINKEEATKNLLKSVDSELLPATQAYKKALTSNVDSMTITSDSGKNLSLVLQDLASQSMGLKASWLNLETSFTKEFSANYVSALDSFGLALGNGKSGLDHFATGLGTAVGALGGFAAAAMHPAKMWNRGISSGLDGLDELFGLGPRESTLSLGPDGRPVWTHNKVYNDTEWAAEQAAAAQRIQARQDAQEQRRFGRVPAMLSATGGVGVPDYLNPKYFTDKAEAERKAALKAHGGGSHDSGWAVPWARSGLLRPSWEAAPQVSIGQELAQQVFQQTAAAKQEQAAQMELHAEAKDIIFYIDGAKDPHAVAQQVEEKIRTTFQNLARLQRVPSKKRM